MLARLITCRESVMHTRLIVSIFIVAGWLAGQETRPSDLPKVPAPDPAAAGVPAGYQVEVAFDGLMYPSSIEIAAERNDLRGRVRVLPGRRVAARARPRR